MKKMTMKRNIETKISLYFQYKQQGESDEKI